MVEKIINASFNVNGTITFGIGILPTYQDIGIFAPLFLVFFRLMQGLSAGGEQVGASLLTMEHAPSGKRLFILVGYLMALP
ncbi:hypothetical protein AB3515_09545 [Acinetobacter baumannii]